MRRVARLMMTVLGGGLSYTQKVKNLFGASLIGYWPLWETSGAVAEDVSGNGHHGQYAGVTLGGETNPLTGKPAPVWDGDNGRYIYLNESGVTPSLSEGAVVLLVKPAADVMAETAVRQLFYLAHSGSGDALQLGKLSTAQTWFLGRFIGSYNPFSSYGYFNSAAWHLVIATWSVAQSVARVYINGNLAAVGEVSISSANTPNMILVGAGGAAAESWKGSISDVAQINRFITPTEALNVFQASHSGYTQTVGIIGDSIPIATTGWPTYAFGNYASGRTKILNHAVASQGILDNMDAQVAAAASDNADLLILALGTNDDNAGNMAALQAKVESSIDALRASNPRATLYYLNVLPRFDGADKANIRTAIAAACAAKSVTCWDPVTTPWIVQADTSDNLHPTAAGAQKIATQVLARL
jgi:hypothetical protein